MTTVTVTSGLGLNFAFYPKGFNLGFLETSGSVIQHNATTIIAAAGSQGWTFTGVNFGDFDGLGWASSGTLTGIEVTALSQTLYQFTGIGVDMADIRFAMDHNSSRAVNNLVFGGDDDITGAEARDNIWGLTGDDALQGVQGNDVLVGGQGQDFLTGGKDKDRFTYQGVTESMASAPDLILDLRANDKIDLRAIDTDKVAAGDQAFHLVSDFTGTKGELRLTYVAADDWTLIEGDTDGDEVANLVIRASGDHTDFSNFSL